MRTLSKILLATTVLVAIPACSSEMSEDEQAIYDARLAEEAKKVNNMLAVIGHNPDLSVANTAIGVSGIAEELQGKGDYTSFVGTNDAFNKLGQEELNGLMKPEKKDELGNLLKYHTVEGNVSAADIAKMIADGAGTASLKTVQGGALKAMMDGDKIVLEDTGGNKANVTQADVKASNGTIHIIDTIMMPG